MSKKRKVEFTVEQKERNAEDKENDKRLVRGMDYYLKEQSLSPHAYLRTWRSAVATLVQKLIVGGKPPLPDNITIDEKTVNKWLEYADAIRKRVAVAQKRIRMEKIRLELKEIRAEAAKTPGVCPEHQYVLELFNSNDPRSSLEYILCGCGDVCWYTTTGSHKSGCNGMYRLKGTDLVVCDSCYARRRHTFIAENYPDAEEAYAVFDPEEEEETDDPATDTDL